MQDSQPEDLRVRLKVVSGTDRIRRVALDKREESSRAWLALGDLHLRRLELDPVVQAAGRARFLTRPREVVFFQMHDLAREVGPCREVRTLLALRRALGIPKASEIDSLVQGLRAQMLMATGSTAEATAKRLGVSRRTVFNRLRQLESASSPYKD